MRSEFGHQRPGHRNCEHPLPAVEPTCAAHSPPPSAHPLQPGWTLSASVLAARKPCIGPEKLDFRQRLLKSTPNRGHVAVGDPVIRQQDDCQPGKPREAREQFVARKARVEPRPDSDARDFCVFACLLGFEQRLKVIQGPVATVAALDKSAPLCAINTAPRSCGSRNKIAAGEGLTNERGGRVAPGRLDQGAAD